MGRPVWSGALTFGLVSLPVKLFTATDSHTIHFHQLQRGTSDRVRNKRVNERTGKEVSLDQIVKGFDAGEEYVLVEPGELDDIAPGRSQALEIIGFVDLEQVEPIFFDKTYYLGPKGTEYAKVYALLEQALAGADKAGIATFVMRNREYLVAVKAEAGLLTLHTLPWPMRSVTRAQRSPNCPARPASATASSSGLAAHRRTQHGVEAGRVPRHIPGTGRRAHRGQTHRRDDREGRTAGKATNVVDLMDALRASVDRAKHRKDEGEEKAASPGAPPARIKDAADKRRVGQTAKAQKQTKASSFDSLTKAELYQRATDARIPGRSSMYREELIKALRGNRGRRKTDAS